MAVTYTEADKLKLYQFTKSLAVKVAQIVVQSRRGKKVTHELNAVNSTDRGHSSSNNLQWFSLSIPDEPEVSQETIGVLNGGVVEALTKVLCIEISLRTTDGEGMVLEQWTMKIMPGKSEVNANSISTIYYRMSLLLKTTLTITRMTPAYKMSRAQHKESYKIYHKIYSGEPNFKLLGEQYKSIKVGELDTHVGTIVIQVMHRTKMTILPEDKIKTSEIGITPAVGDIMVKSDHFYTESPKKNVNDKKEVDLSKPLTAGAFVDEERIRELHDALSQQLPPEPPMTWLLAETEKMEKCINHWDSTGIDELNSAGLQDHDFNSELDSLSTSKMKNLTTTEKEDIAKPVCSNEPSTSSTPHSISKAIDVPRAKNGDKYTSLMEFPFADGSPMAELANFYQECVQAKSASDEWTDIVCDASRSTDSDSLSQQLKMFEDAVPEFDNMVASMFSTSDNSSDN